MPKTQRRRRIEGKTDYKARFAMLKSEKPRLVVRKTNKHIIAQIVESKAAQDNVLITVSSKDLLEKGWPKDKSGSLKSLMAAYLTGYLLVKSLKEKPKEVIFDLGMHRHLAGSRIYAALRGAVDAGLNIPHDPKALPTDERLKSNEKTASLFKMKEKL
jgi:large subunit ribosomal protein L18